MGEWNSERKEERIIGRPNERKNEWTGMRFDGMGWDVWRGTETIRNGMNCNGMDEVMEQGRWACIRVCKCMYVCIHT